MVHLSGHGLPAGLLEDDTGRHDLITSTDLVDLAAAQIKLVTLSACESAAATAAEHLHLLSLAQPTRADPAPLGSCRLWRRRWSAIWIARL